MERALGLREGGKGPVGLDLDFPEVECCAGEPNNESGTEVRILLHFGDIKRIQSA